MMHGIILVEAAGGLARCIVKPHKESEDA